MNYLEQLKQESAKRQAQEQEILQKRAQQRQYFEAEVIPSLERLYAYLRELAKHLNYVKPTVLVNYDIKGYGQLEVQQQEYLVVTHEEGRARSKNYARPEEHENALFTRYNFFLRCQGVAPHKIRLEKHKLWEVNVQKEFFISHHLRFTCSEETTRYNKFIRAVFVMEPLIPMEFEFVGNAETRSLNLTLINFPELGQRVYTLQPQEINDEFLNEFAKYLVRQPNHLVLQSRQWYTQAQPLSPQQKDQLEFAVWLQRTQRELGELVTEEELQRSTDNNHEEFDAWLRQQEAELALKSPSSVVKKGVRGFFRKIGKG